MRAPRPPLHDRRPPVASLLAVGLAALSLALSSLPAEARAGDGDPCDGQGEASLALIGDVPAAVGTYFDVLVTGRPLAPFSLLADFGDGPVTVPRIGTFCLDLGPRRRNLIDGIREGAPTLGADGTYRASVRVPLRPEIAGETFHFQAVVEDDTAPNGYALTNGLAVRILPSILETFTTTERKEESATNAIWEGDGRVIGVPVSPPRTVEYAPAESPFNLAHPLIERNNPFTDGTRFQMLFVPAALQAAPGESILGMSWGPKSDFTFVSTYEDLAIRLGNLPVRPGTPQLAARFDVNFDAGRPAEPVTVFEGRYDIENGVSVPWEEWPSFSAPFEYHFDRPLVFEVELPVGGDTYQLLRNRSTAAFPNHRIFGDAGTEVAEFGGENTTYSTRFLLQQDRGLAQSIYVRADAWRPQWYAAYVHVHELPDGSSIDVEYGGAFDVDEDGEPDLNSETSFATVIDAVGHRQLLRFRIVLRPNAQGEVPVVDAIAIPYEETAASR